MKRDCQRLRIVIIIAILILVLLLLYSGLQILESTVLQQNTVHVEESTGKTIDREDVSYFPRQDITVIMIAGVDTTGPMVDSGSYNNPAEADMINLLIFDETNKDVDILSLNRDTMVEMTVLGLGGKPAGTRYAQLSLSHTYGSGLDDSSRNLLSTVSKLLYGVDIDHYVTMNMDAIALLNDAVGGVTVNVSDDFSKVDPTIPMGKVTLRGQQATNYVRMRYEVGDQLNVSRMERQQEYMTNFIIALKEKMESDPTFILDTYDEVSDHIVTDCSATTIYDLANEFSDHTLSDSVTIKGNNVAGDVYMEFYLDEDDLDRVILEYLYAPKG